MTINPDAVGTPQGTFQRSWRSTDAILYALGVGAGTSELAYTTENSHSVDQQVLPTFGVIIGHPGYRLVGLGDFDGSRLIHGRQEIEFFAPIPPEGTVEVSGVITDLQDKGPGKHAVVDVSTDVIDLATRSKLLTSTYTVVLRGAGGFGGTSGRGAGTVVPTVPDRAADWEVSQTTSPEQALLYRLSGDRNPLHSDPWFARERAGFAKPILHGLCTYGFAGRALLNTLCGGESGKFGRMSARFTAPVFPGDSITTRIWCVPGGAVFRCTAGPDDRVVINEGNFELR